MRRIDNDADNFTICSRELAGASFIGFAIGESLGASALRIAGGIFTKIADIGSDLMKIEFGIKEDDREILVLLLTARVITLEIA